MTSIIDQKISKAVSLVSQSQIYQRKLFIFFCLIWSQVAFNTLINSFVLTNPLFMENGQSSTEANCCLKQQISECYYVNQFTGTFHAELYCQHRNTRMFLQSMFGLGAIIGLLSVPIIGDVKGKRVSISLCLLCMVLGNFGIFVGILYKIYFIIGIGQIFSAFGAASIAIVSYSISSDFFSDNLRQKSVMFYFAAWGLSDMSVIIVYYLTPNWVFYMIFLLIIPSTILMIYFKSFFIESIHFFIQSKNDFNSAQQAICKLAEVNKADSFTLQKSKSILKEIQIVCNKITKQEQSIKQILKIIFGTKDYLKAIIYLVLVRMAYTAFYYGVQGSLQRTGFNLGISIFLLGFGQFTGCYTGSFFIPKCNRKKVVLITSIILIIISIIFISQTVSQNPFLASFLLYICFVLNSHNFCAISLLENQSYPSYIRSTSIGLEMGGVTTLRLMIPFIIGFLNQKQIPPIFGLGILRLLLGIIPAILIKQTYGYTNIQQPLLNPEMEMEIVQQNQEIRKK